MAGSFKATDLRTPALKKAELDFQHIVRFEEAGLLPGAAPLVARTLHELLAAPSPQIPPGSASPVHELASLVEPWLDWVGPRLDDPTGQDLVMELLGSPWFPWQRREHAAFKLAAHAHGPSPRTVEELRAYLLTDPNDSDLAKALAVWVTKFHPSPDDVWQVFEPHAWVQLPAELVAVLEFYAAYADPGELAEFSNHMIRRLPATAVNQEFLRHAGYRNADQLVASKTLSEVASKAISKPDHRKNVLDAWLCLAPTEAEARTLLVENVALPFIQQADVVISQLLSNEYASLVTGLPDRARADLATVTQEKLKGKANEKTQLARMEELRIVDLSEHGRAAQGVLDRLGGLLRRG